MNTIAVKVNKSHFDASARAIANGKLTSERCLVAQAIRGLYPRRSVSVGNVNVIVGNGVRRKDFTLSEKAQKLVLAFDSLSFHKPNKAEQKKSATLRAKLPLTIEMTTESLNIMGESVNHGC